MALCCLAGQEHGLELGIVPQVVWDMFQEAVSEGDVPGLPCDTQEEREAQHVDYWWI